MKIHGSRFHPDYWRTKFCACPVVRLDGVAQKNVIMADDVFGLVEIGVYVNGKPLIENGRFKSELLVGQVEIIGDRHVWLRAS